MLLGGEIVVSSKDIEKEGWLVFSCSGDFVLSLNEVDELALDTYKWALKLQVEKLKNNSIFIKRVKEAKKRREIR